MDNNMLTLNQTIGEKDAELVKTIQNGVRLQIEMNLTKGFPVARFDAEINKPYLEYPDGRKEYR